MQKIILMEFDAHGQQQAIQQSGKLVPANLRPMPDGEFLFPIQLDPGKVGHFAVMLQSTGSIQLPFEVLTAEAMHEVTKTKYLVFGFYYGVTALILLYSMFLTVSLRKKIYITYVFYVLSVILSQMGLHGFAYQYLWPQWHEWNRVSTIFFVGLMFVTLSIFTIVSLRLRETSRFFYYLLWGFAAVSGIVSMAALFVYGNTIIRLTGLLTSVLPLVILPAGLVAWKKGERFAPFYVCAVTFYLFGASSYGLKDSGFLPANFLTENGILLGSLIEIAVLSLGIAVEIRSINSESARLSFSLEKANALSERASQISHDIRSPLSALNMAVSFLKDVPEEQRLLVRSATQRINDIANNLLSQNRVISGNVSSAWSKEMSAVLNEPVTTQLIPAVVDSLISEKRLQYKTKIGVEILAKFNQESYGLFADVQLNELKRVLSNLVNNSVEAVGESGNVEILLSRANGQACAEDGVSCASFTIEVKDNGKGIPESVLPRLMQRGESFGKSDGSGLGLYHAKKAVEAWGGQISIESVEAVGTSVAIGLPEAQNPSWFVSKIRLPKGVPIVILDDDDSIHKVWQKRLETLQIELAGTNVFHFSEVNEIESWLEKNAASADKATFLIDYELLGTRRNGLDIIERAAIQRTSIVVTSRFEESEIRERCERIGTRLLPKNSVGFVPIEVVAPLARLDAILIDDDSLVRMVWENAAKERGLVLATFPSSDGFYEIAEEIDRSTPIYVDSNLGGGVRGEELSQRIAKMGFCRLFLATGYESEQFPPMPWLSGVTGKDVPWMV